MISSSGYRLTILFFLLNFVTVNQLEFVTTFFFKYSSVISGFSVTTFYDRAYLSQK